MKKKFNKLCSMLLSSFVTLSAGCAPALAGGKEGDNEVNFVVVDENGNDIGSEDESQHWNELFGEINKIKSEPVKKVIFSRVGEALELSAFRDVVNSPELVSEMTYQDREENFLDAFEDSVSAFNLYGGGSPVPFEIKTELNIKDDFVALSYILSHREDFKNYEALCYLFRIGLSCDLAKFYCLKSGLRNCLLRKSRKSSDYEPLKEWCYKQQKRKSIEENLIFYANYLGAISKEI